MSEDEGCDGPPGLIVSESEFYNTDSGDTYFALSDDEGAFLLCDKDNEEKSVALSESDNNDMEDPLVATGSIGGAVCHSSHGQTQEAHARGRARGRGRPRKWRRTFTSSRVSEPKADSHHSPIASPSSSFFGP